MASSLPFPNILSTWAYSCPSSLKVSSRFSLLLECQRPRYGNSRRRRGRNALVLVLSSAPILATLSLVLRHIGGARSGGAG